MNEIDRVFTKYPVFGSYQSHGRTTFGAATLPTFQCPVGSCIWWQIWTGRPKGVGMAAVEHAGRQLLRRGFELGHRQIRQAQNYEH